MREDALPAQAYRHRFAKRFSHRTAGRPIQKVEEFIHFNLSERHLFVWGITMGYAIHRRFFSIHLVLITVLLSCGACTHAELVSKADAYDSAIWDSNNKQILLNAVRASQRAPMSFVGFGDVLTSPSFSGNTGATFNLQPSGLTNYSVSPNIAYNGGFSQFTINNLNHSEFATKMHHPIDDKLVAHFHALNWPKEMVDLLLLHSIETTKSQYAQLERIAWSKCASDGSSRTTEICGQLRMDREQVQGCSPVETEGPKLTILNSARELCSMIQFQYALRMIRLLNKNAFPGKRRSPEGILYYLGEMIAAQNYSVPRHVPTTFIATRGKRRLVSLFVVERGVSANAAVQIFLNGEGFYIPRPNVGSADEERSLQVLDLVTQAIVMATSKDALPKTNSVSLIAVR